VFTVCAQVGLALKVCVYVSVCVCTWKEQAIYSLCIPGDLSLKLHIHDTSLWGLEGHHQIEGLTSAGTHTHAHTHMHTHTHTENNSRILSAAVSPWKAQHLHFPGSSVLFSEGSVFLLSYIHATKPKKRQRKNTLCYYNWCVIAEQPAWLLCITNPNSSVLICTVIICLFETNSLQCSSSTANSNTLSWTRECKLLRRGQIKTWEVELEVEGCAGGWLRPNHVEADLSGRWRGRGVLA